LKSESIREELKDFAQNYENFLGKAFNNVNRQKDALSTTHSAQVAEGLATSIIGLDGTLFNWQFNKKKVKSMKISIVYSDGKSERKKINSYFLLKKTDKVKMRRVFLSAMLHSVDASIVRLVIVKYYELTGQKIHHLHDGFSFNPKFYPEFMKAINWVYKEHIFSKDIFFETYVKKALENFPNGKQKENFIKSYREFQSLQDNPVIRYEKAIKTYVPES